MFDWLNWLAIVLCFSGSGELDFPIYVFSFREDESLFGCLENGAEEKEGALDDLGFPVF